MMRIQAVRAVRSNHGRSHVAVVVLPRRLFSSRASNNSSMGARTISSTSTAKKAAIATPTAIRPIPTTSTATSKSIIPLVLPRSALPWIGNLSYMALASGFLMTDMLELRVLLVGGYTGLVAFHSLHERPLRIPLRWSAVFVAVNAAAACLLLADQYTTFSNPQDEQLYHEHFERYMTRGQFQSLLTMATRQSLPAGTRLTRENVPCNSMYFLLQGQAHVFHGTTTSDEESDTDNIASIEQGGFVNDVAFQRTGNNGVVGAYGTVSATQDCDVLVWDIPTLKQYMLAKPELERTMNYCMSDHLVKSLLRQRDARHQQLQLQL